MASSDSTPKPLPLSHLPDLAAILFNFTLFAIRRFQANRVSQAAGALTYSTLLALVPLLLIAFAILSSCPAFDTVRTRMRAMFFDMLVPFRSDLRHTFRIQIGVVFDAFPTFFMALVASLTLSSTASTSPSVT